MKKPVKVLLITGSIIVLLPIVLIIVFVCLILIKDSRYSQERQQKIDSFYALSQKEKNQRVSINLLDSIVGAPMPNFNVDSLLLSRYVSEMDSYVKEGYKLVLLEDIPPHTMRIIKKQFCHGKMWEATFVDDVYSIAYEYEYSEDTSQIVGENIICIYPNDRKIEILKWQYGWRQQEFMSLSQEEKNKRVESNLLDSIIGVPCPAFDVINYFHYDLGPDFSEDYVLTLKSAFSQLAIEALNDSVQKSEYWEKENGTYRYHKVRHSPEGYAIDDSGLYIYPQKLKVVSSYGTY